MNLKQVECTEEDIQFSEVDRLQLSCRLCLAPEQHVPLNTPYQGSITYVEVLQQLADVQVVFNDCLPKKICVECASKLVLFYKFRKKIEMTQTTLSETLKRATKSEEFDDKTGIEMLDQDVGMMVDHTVEIDEVYDQYGDEKSHKSYDDYADEEDHLYEEHQNFIDLDDAIEETYTEATASEQNSVNELIVDGNVTIIDGRTYMVEKKKSRKQTNHQCDECGRVFTRKTVLEQHKNTHTGIKNFSCEICKSLFTRRSHLSIHMRIHENSKPYICEICSRGFRKSGDLARHRRIHFADRNYPCSMCDKRFKRATDVTSHMRTHTKAKPYTCKHPKCDKKYTSHSSLRKHEMRKHEEPLPDSADKAETSFQIVD